MNEDRLSEFPGMVPLLTEQAKMMALDTIPGGEAIHNARFTRALLLIDGQITGAIRGPIKARKDILDHVETHLATLELTLRAAIMMAVHAYQLSELEIPKWLNRYGPLFHGMTSTDLVELDEDDVIPLPEQPDEDFEALLREPPPLPAIEGDSPGEVAELPAVYGPPTDPDQYFVTLGENGEEPPEVLEALQPLHHVNDQGFAFATEADDKFYAVKWRHPTQDEVDAFRADWIANHPPAPVPPPADEGASTPPPTAAAPKPAKRRRNTS